jgi:hypothetical protein
LIPANLKKCGKGRRKSWTSVPELVRIFIAEVARTGSVPVSMTLGEEPLFSSNAETEFGQALMTPKPGEVYIAPGISNWGNCRAHPAN